MIVEFGLVRMKYRHHALQRYVTQIPSGTVKRENFRDAIRSSRSAQPTFVPAASSESVANNASLLEPLGCSITALRQRFDALRTTLRYTVYTLAKCLAGVKRLKGTCGKF